MREKEPKRRKRKGREKGKKEKFAEGEERFRERLAGRFTSLGEPELMLKSKSKLTLMSKLADGGEEGDEDDGEDDDDEEAGNVDDDDGVAI